MTQEKILLHACCGPCMIYPVEVLQEQGFEVVALFYNPNIHPLKEYLRRRQGVLEIAEHLDIKVIFKDDEYDPVQYFRHVTFRENMRCYFCYQMRLERTFSIASRGRFDYFSTTLLYSKIQNHQQITDLGESLAGGGRLRFYYSDFRQGWKYGVEKSKELGIYRQDYCGCVYSEMERFRRELDK